jgi:hypothetical protein
VTCEVRGADAVVEREFTDARGHGAEYACAWCMSEVVAIAGRPRRRPPYRPVDERWAAGARRDDPGTEHAVTGRVATGKATLCGVENAAIEVYRHLWRPESPRACHECAVIAYEVDARWPCDRRLDC